MTARRRVAAITGASSGVGRACARLFADRGWDVGLIARNVPALENARAEVEALGGRALVAPADVADAAAVEASAAAIERELGPIEAWINSAMTSVFSPVERLEPLELERVTAVTYLGNAYGTMAALRRMRPRDRGVIVQVGSALAYRAIPLQAAYCAAKHALQGFTESVRCELLHERSRVRVSMVQLPALNTPHFEVARSRLPGQPRPVAPVYEPEIAARAVYDAATRLRRREFNVGWMSSGSIVANNLVPGLLDRYLARTGWRSQQLPEPAPADRADNLFAPPDRDLGARGRFGGESASRSPHLWFERHRRPLALAGLAAALWRAASWKNFRRSKLTR